MPHKVIQILVLSLDEQVSYNVEVHVSRAIFHVKQYLSYQEGIEMSDKNLMYASRILPDENTIEAIGLAHGSILREVPKDEQQLALYKYIEVFVKTHTEDQIAIDVRSHCKSFSVKNDIEKLTEILASNQNLIFNHQEWPDEKTVAEMGLVNGSSLRLVLKMVDGFKRRILSPAPAPEVEHNRMVHISCQKIYWQFEMIVYRKVDQFYCVTCTDGHLRPLLTQLVLADLGISLELVYDKQDQNEGSFIKLTFAINSRELHAREMERRAAIEAAKGKEDANDSS